jgi:hypothetical protein
LPQPGGPRRRYPKEEDSTIIFRLVEAELVEELYEEKGKTKPRSPQSLPPPCVGPGERARWTPGSFCFVKQKLLA